jgi:hypothetical protein
MLKSALSLCIVVLAIQTAIAEDRAAAESKQTKKCDIHLRDNVVVLVENCPSGDNAAVFPQKDGSPCKRVAASVVGIRPNGDLQIEGRSEVQVGDDVWQRSLTGEVPCASLGPDRTVRCADIAELRHTIRKKKMIGENVVPSEVAPHPVRQVSAQSPVTSLIGELHQKQTELAQLQQEIRELQAKAGASQQILVQVRVLECSLTKMRRMGFEVDELSSTSLGPADLTRLLARMKTGRAAPKTPKARLNSDGGEGIIDWLVSNNIGRVLSEPVVVVLDGRPAQLHVGGDFPMPTKTDSKAVEYQPIGTQLDLLATSLGDDRVRMDIRVRLSEVDSGKSMQIKGTSVPVINVQQIDTGIVSKFGQSSALPGMVATRTEAIKTEAGIREVDNQICTLFVITPERFETPETARRSDTKAPPR